jgi:hypothetical protein
VKRTPAENYTKRVESDGEMPQAPIDPEPIGRLPAILLSVALAVSLLGCGESAISKIEVTLRNAPNQESNIVTRIPQGSVVSLSKCSHGWCQVSWNGQQGYAFAKNFIVGGARPGADADDDKQDFDNADD